MAAFKERLAAYADVTEKALEGFLPLVEAEYRPVVEAMRYSVLGGGKRIRAALILEYCRIYSGEFLKALPFAAAMEMIHAYSLIHDDLPCMDDDDMRRGKPSCHVAYGEAMALLAGDGLLTKAFETILLNTDPLQVPCDRIMRAAGIQAAAAGSDGMVGGQVIDLANETRTADLATLNTTNALKTGAMIRAAAKIGCIVGGAGEREIAWADEYAKDLGLAFQIVDDILDEIGDEAVLGKPVGSDKDNHKSTYVSVYGIEKSKEVAQELIERSKETLRTASIQDPFLYDLADLVVQRQN